MHCQWSAWKVAGGSAGRCTKACGGGTRTLTRTISKQSLHGGKKCAGPSAKTEPCNTQSCPPPPPPTIRRPPSLPPSLPPPPPPNNEKTLIDGLVGCYEIDRSICLKGKFNSEDWYFVKITWNAGSNTFTWKNRAGVSWTLNPCVGCGGWEKTKLTVGKDNPYFSVGYKTAAVEWVGPDILYRIWQKLRRQGSYTVLSKHVKIQTCKNNFTRL